MSTESHACGLPPDAGADPSGGRGRVTARSTGIDALLDRLSDINLDDLFDAAGLMSLRRTPLRRLFLPTARRFAAVALEFDHLVGARGLAFGSAWLAQRMSGGWRVSGSAQVPATGPAVILANHPGMTDTVALIASLAARADLRVIALDRPFLRALPNVARHLILLPDDDRGRMGVVRAGVRHLKQGGALLTFPAGEIEPDPATFGVGQALESAQRWSSSYALFARQVPQTRFVPAIVSHVVSPQAQRNVLTLMRRSEPDKQRLAAALQVALPRYRRQVARVAFGAAQGAGEDAESAEGGLQSAIAAEIRRLIEATSLADADAGVGAEANADAGVVPAAEGRAGGLRAEPAQATRLTGR